MTNNKRLYVGLTKSPEFFSDVYSYFMRGGYYAILIENILHIITTGSTLAFITFVTFCVDWNSIGRCQSEDTCNNFSEYVIYPKHFHTTFTVACMIMFIIVFSIYWVITLLTLVKESVRYLRIRNYFKNIGIRTDEIKVLTWLDVVKNMIENDNDLNPEIIVGSVMNKDNYLIAMVGSSAFNIDEAYYTKVFLWVINVVVLNQIFSQPNNKKISVDTHAVSNMIKILAVAQIILCPFTFTLTIVHSIINVTTDIYTGNSYLGPKEWTTHARLSFREYNELPHIFDIRINKSYEHAGKYEQKFSAHIMNMLMKRIIFTLGTFLTLLVFLTFYNETLVLYIKLFNRSLIWYITILVTLITVCRMAIVDTTSINESAEEIMEKIAEHTHYFPECWKGKCHKCDILEKYKTLFTYKLVNILYELISIFYIPYYMLYKMPDDLEKIALFIEGNTKYCEGIGHICSAGLSTNLNVFSTYDGDYASYELLIEDEKIKRSLANFNNYYSSTMLQEGKKEIYTIHEEQTAEIEEMMGNNDIDEPLLSASTVEMSMLKSGESDTF